MSNHGIKLDDYEEKGAEQEINHDYGRVIWVDPDLLNTPLTMPKGYKISTPPPRCNCGTLGDHWSDCEVKKIRAQQGLQ
jgi:hypothetical protein